MEIRKLESAEHGKTRFLWEKIFKEDSQTFVDYYYFIRTRENTIYVVEEDGAIRSMLQKNPYRMKLEDSVFDSEYIVGVATEKEYRSRGYMRQLLIAALEEENKKKHPFTFLMPAAEAIYSPYDFRYIYHQKQMELDSDFFSAIKRDKKTGEKESRDRGRQERVTRDAGLGDAERIAAFFEKNESPKWAVCTVRDSVYYQTKILEQQSESGGVRMIFEEKDLIGVFFYAREEELEILSDVYGVVKEVGIEKKKGSFRRFLTKSSGKMKLAEHLTLPEEEHAGKVLDTRGMIQLEEPAYTEGGIALFGEAKLQVMYEDGTEKGNLL